MAKLRLRGLEIATTTQAPTAPSCICSSTTKTNRNAAGDETAPTRLADRHVSQVEGLES